MLAKDCTSILEGILEGFVPKVYTTTSSSYTKWCTYYGFKTVIAREFETVSSLTYQSNITALEMKNVTVPRARGYQRSRRSRDAAEVWSTEGVWCCQQMARQNSGKEWSHGLWGCFDNCSISCLSLLLPCYAFGKNASKVGDHALLCCIGSTIPFLNIWFGTIIRKKVRRAAGVQGDALTDAFTWLVCPCCALIQEGQELHEMEGRSKIARV